MSDNFKFTVDTHLFRELGDLLVGRDSTALVELIKNSYDADATEITLDGQNIANAKAGRIIISDDGIGMTPDVFEDGFLRIASRMKEEGTRKSPNLKRRFTGEKGIGRLSAHKLAEKIQIESIPDQQVFGNGAYAVEAKIDWDMIESLNTLDDVEGSGALEVESFQAKGKPSGTTITLTNLRKKWTDRERARVVSEVASFQPPKILLDAPNKYIANKPLFSTPLCNETGGSDTGFKVTLEGDFDVGDEYWHSVADAAAWLIEIDAHSPERVRFQISPTKRTLSTSPQARVVSHTIKHPEGRKGPKFHSRIYVRTGPREGSRSQRAWVGNMSGVRIYMEGFRVLPYGDRNDDWLGLTEDYRKRARTLSYLENIGLDSSEAQKDGDEGLSALGNNAYFGAVFFTHNSASTLRMLVNREGFIPDASFDSVQQIVRVGTDLAVRANASARLEVRQERKAARSVLAVSQKPQSVKSEVSLAVESATSLLSEAKLVSSRGNAELAASLVEQAAEQFSLGTELSERMVAEVSLTRILSGIGLQMSAFVHELNALLNMTQVIQRGIDRIRLEAELKPSLRKDIALLSNQFSDLRQSVERQAAYLTDVTSPDSRRRRSRLKIAERFDSAARVFYRQAAAKSVTIENKVDQGLKTGPMYPAELSLVFTNLLQNALKATKKGGQIRFTSRLVENKLCLRLENTGTKVNLRDAERWFRPFESTTDNPDPTLGQGMGMGLPITRNMLEEYGADISFVKPSKGFSTAIELVLS